MKSLRGLLFGLAGLLVAVPGFASPSLCDATAANLVPNCGFETGDFTSWTQVGSFMGVVTTGDISGLNPNSGAFYAALGTFNGDGSLGPTVGLTTVPGQTYTFSFWLANTVQGDALNPNDFSADWGGTNVLAFNNAAPMPYTFFTFTETATSNSTTIGFTERNDSGFWGLDDVSVVPTNTTPEPGSIFLLGTGLVGILIGRRALRRES